MAGEWQEIPLSQIAKLRSGFPFKSASWTDSGVPVIKIANIKGGRIVPDGCGYVSPDTAATVPEWETREGDVLIAMTGYVGEIALVRPGEKYLINQRVGRFEFLDSARVIPKFLFFYLSQPEVRSLLETMARGSAQPNLSARDIELLRVPVPPIAEQRAIAHILGTLDDKIELNRKQNETLEAMARALFKAWFVDFEPVRAKMEGRWQRGQSLPGLPAHLYDLFPDRLVESELGEIPEGWTVRAIEDVIKRLSVGKKYDQKTVNKEGRTPVLDQGKSGILGYHNDEPGVVATVDNPVVVFANHTCLMRLISYPFSAIQNVLPFIGKGISTIWVFYASIGKQSFVEYKGHWPDFVQHKVVVPPVNLAEIFSAYVHGYLRAIWQNEAESRPLIHLHDTLLPKLISGELRVPDVDRFMEAMA